MNIGVAEGFLSVSEREGSASLKELEELLLRYVAGNESVSVRQLFDVAHSKNPSMTEVQFMILLRDLEKDGSVRLEDFSQARITLSQYLRMWDRNLWFYGSVAVSLLTLLLVYLAPAQMPFLALRWAVGCVFVLLIPGYVALEALCPKTAALNTFQRFTLGFGLSLALVPLVVLVLNYTAWGIRLTPVVIILTVLSLGLSGVALARHYLAS